MIAELLQQPGFTPALLVVAGIMYTGWTVAYLATIRLCLKQKTYGLPFSCICFNVTWEVLFSFNLLGQDLNPFFLWGNRLWLLIDIPIVTQMILYGRRAQTMPFLQKHYYTALAITFVLIAGWLITFTIYYGDYTGTASSMTENLVMSVLFIFMLLNRRGAEGLSCLAAWSKMVGTAAGAVFLAYWLPAQYVESESGTRVLRSHPWVREPMNYCYMYYLYISIFFIDCLYIYLLSTRKKELLRSQTLDNSDTNPASLTA